MTATHTCMLEQQCLQDSDRWFGDQIPDIRSMRSLIHHTLALCGEVGEVANIIKKIDRGSLDARNAITRNDLAMELADVYTYLLNVAGIVGIDLEKAYNTKRGINDGRFVAARRMREELQANGN